MVSRSFHNVCAAYDEYQKQNGNDNLARNLDAYASWPSLISWGFSGGTATPFSPGASFIIVLYLAPVAGGAVRVDGALSW